MVTAVSRISFLCRKIRLSPKSRRLLETISSEKEDKYLLPIMDVVTRWSSTSIMGSKYLSPFSLETFCSNRLIIICWLGPLKSKMLSDTFYRHKDQDLINLVLTEEGLELCFATN
jgi:hypothetical protein